MPASRLRFFLASEQNRDHQIDPDLVETALTAGRPVFSRMQCAMK